MSTRREMWRRAVDGLSAELLLRVINEMPSTQRRFVLASVGAGAASQASRPMAAQVLARLRSNSGVVDELVSTLCMPALTLFSHELDVEDWDDLLGDDAASAALVYSQHPEVAILMHQLVETDSAFLRLQLVAASSGGAIGALAALNLLGVFDDEATQEYAALAAAEPLLPDPTEIDAVAPLERVAELSEEEIPAHVTPTQVMELIRSVAPKHRDTELVDTSKMSLSELFDGLIQRLRAVAQLLADGALPDPQETAAMHRMALKVTYDAAVVGAHDRASLEKLTEQASIPQVDPGRWWLLRLAAAKGPQELAEDLSDLSELAGRAAWELTHPKDAALAGMLDLVDLAASQRAGGSVDVSRLLAAQAAATTGLHGLEHLVFAAGTGLVTVPAVDDETAYVDTTAAPVATTKRRATEQPTTQDAKPQQDDPSDETSGELVTGTASDAGNETLAGTPEGQDGDTENASANEDNEIGQPTLEASGAAAEPDATATRNEAQNEDEARDVALPAALARYISPAPKLDSAKVPDQVDAPLPEAANLNTAIARGTTATADAATTWASAQNVTTQGELIAQGRYGVAAHLAKALGAERASVDARCLSGYAAALGNPTGVMAAEFSQLAGTMNREALGDDRIGQLLAWSSAAKVALLAPSAGPADVLVNMTPCVSASPALEEVSAALVEAARSGVVVVAPEVLAAAGANSAAHARVEDLSQRATDLATKAKHRTLKYLPAGDVYNAWLAPEGALAFVLGAVRANDREQAAAVGREIVEKLRGRAERYIDSVFSALNQGRNRSGRIVAQPRQQLVARWDEVVDLAADWVAVCEEIAALETASSTGSWYAGALTRLRHQISPHRQSALNALTSMCLDAGIPEDATDGPVHLLTQAFDACDGTVPGDAEPPAVYVTNGELLAVKSGLNAVTLEPQHALNAYEWQQVAASPAAAPRTVYARLADAGAHDLTAVLVAGVRGHDPATADTLEAARTRDILTMDAEVQDRLRDMAGDIDLRRVEGVLGDDLWARASSVVEALRAQGRRDYARITEAADDLEFELELERSARIAATVTHVTEVSTGDTHVAEFADKLIDLARAGQVSSAQEQLQQVIEGNSMPGPDNRGEHLARFFPHLPSVLSALPNPLERLNQAVRLGEHNEITREFAAAGVDLLALSDARRKQARESFAAWNDLGAANPMQHSLPEIDKLRIILRQAGIEFRTLKKTSGQRDRQLLQLANVDVLGKALTPVLGSDRSPDGDGLRVLLVRKAPTPATIIESLASHPSDSTVLILWLARTPLKPEDWRAIAETSRGRASSNPPAVVMDASVLVYLAAQAEPRLSTLAATTLPFAATNPYRDTPGRTAPEMFYGRTEERVAIAAMNGSSFVSGGRQLGKSALLRHVAGLFNETSTDHVAIVMSIYRVGKGNAPEQVWSVLWPELAERDIVTGPLPERDIASAIYASVRAWIKDNPSRQLLLLLDEADDFLDADAVGNRFENVEWFRRLMLETDRSVKVVLAGLHATARFESLPNQPLSHLGRPVVVGPLRPAHARDLLTGPLTAIGYQFDSEITVAQVLAQANNMPAQLQLIGAALAEHMSSKPLDAAGPPTLIAADDVTAAFTPKLREALREKFTLTLALDPRYKVIAYVVAQAAHERGSDASLSLGELQVECRGAWPEGFKNLGADAFRGLVTECVDLGVLARDSNRFRMRTPSVRRLLGTEIEVFEELAAASETLTVPAAYDGSVFRREIAALDGAISPLTERQFGAVFTPGPKVVVVAGSIASGLDRVLPTLEEVAGAIQHGGVVHRVTNTRPEGVTSAIAKATGPTRLLVDLRTAGPVHVREILRAAATATAATTRDITIVLITGPASAAAWVGHENLVELERIEVNGMRLLAGADMIALHDSTSQERAVVELGGWLQNIAHVRDLFAGPGHRYDAGELIDHVVQDMGKHRGRLITAAGVNPASESALGLALGHIHELTGSARERLDVLVDLLDVLDDDALQQAIARDEFVSTHAVVDALVSLGALTVDAAGTWAPERVLAEDLAAVVVRG